MRSDSHAVSQGLLDGRSHGLFVAGVAAASDVRRGDRAHQGFLRAIGNGFGQFAHVAIQIDL
jgi:hypothetical protein